MIEAMRKVVAISLGAAVAAAAMLSACGEDAETGAAPSSATTGTPGSGGQGGVGEGGAATTGQGAQGGMGSDCPHEGPPIIDPARFDECTPACGGAHCVPATLVPPDQQAQLAPCTTGGEDGFCTPDPFIETAGNFIPDSCVSIAGAEGRCLSECLPDVAAQAVVLPVSTCATGERCVPCFDPLTQETTGACTLSCDPGPTEDPVQITCPWQGPPVIDPAMLPACDPACNGAHCLPGAFVSPADQALLAPCPGGFCAPDTLIAGGGQALPATCTSVAGAEGRCLSTCLPDIAAQSLLPQSTCNADERCAPCFDPTASDPTLPTGACDLACDAPTQAPVELTCPWTGPPVIDPTVLPECSPACGGAHCLPAAYVPPAQQAQLAACPGGFCVPDPLISTASNHVPATCTPFPNTTAEGRCLSECLPDVAAQAGSLIQATCAAGEYCVPCFDPFNGSDTGACSTSSCDQPAQAPYTFPTCCPFNSVDQGTCVPTSLVPSGQQGDLQQLGCPTSFLCVPNEYLPTPTKPIATCSTFLGPGACVSECTTVPTFFGQADCPDANYQCVPCAFAPSTPGC